MLAFTLRQELAPSTLPGVYIRQLDAHTYLVTAYGGDQDGSYSPDNEAI